MFMFVKVTPLHLHTNINRLIHLILADIACFKFDNLGLPFFLFTF